MAHSSSRHYCTVCRSWYRTWSLHASSKTHMGNLRKRANPSSSRKGIRRGFSKLAGRRRPEGEERVKVDDYYRNPPTPPWPAEIRDRVYYVVDHWRHEPYRAVHV